MLDVGLADAFEALRANQLDDAHEVRLHVQWQGIEQASTSSSRNSTIQDIGDYTFFAI